MGDMADWNIENGIMPFDGMGPEDECEDIDVQNVEDENDFVTRQEI